MTIAVDLGHKATKQTNKSLTVKGLTEHHLEFLSIKGGCTDSS